MIGLHKIGNKVSNCDKHICILCVYVTSLKKKSFFIKFSASSKHTHIHIDDGNGFEFIGISNRSKCAYTYKCDRCSLDLLSASCRIHSIDTFTHARFNITYTHVSFNYTGLSYCVHASIPM